MDKKQTIILCFIFAFSAFALRLLPHPWNFTPLGAFALASGFWLPKKYLGLPLAVRFFSDLIIGLFAWQIMLIVYASHLFATLLGFYLKRFYSWPTIILSGIIGSLVFFFSTNAAVWAWGGMYPHTAGGLLASYYAGLPFFRASLIGDLFYLVIFAGIYEGVGFLSLTFSRMPRGKVRDLLKHKTRASLVIQKRLGD